MPGYKRHISYLPALLSISLVIFIFGFLCLFMLEANKLKTAIKQDVRMSIYLRDEANDSLVNALHTELIKWPYIYDVHYISKEEGLKIITGNVGENPDSLLGFNPIPKTLEIRFRERFVNEDSLENLKASLEKVRNVREISYDRSVVQHIDSNIRRVGIALIILAMCMALISIALINSTIRLLMYSKRFIIKSMQFVGATRGFIMRPFLQTGVVIGLLGGIIASCLLLLSIRILSMYFPISSLMVDKLPLIFVMIGILILSMFICLCSSYLSVNRYLRLKLDDLF